MGKEKDIEPSSNVAYTCLHAGQELADPKENPHDHGRAYAIVPEGSKIEYLERPDYPPRRTGTVKLNDTASFLEYWKRQHGGESYIYGSMMPAQFLAVFNENCRPTQDEKYLGNWRDHRAHYALQHSDEWNTWAKMDKQAFEGNEKFAYWLEDNMLDIKNPAPAKFMDIALNMRVKQGQVFGNKVNLNDGNIVLEYTNQVEGSAQSSSGGKIAIPEKFEISIPVFKGLDAKRYTIEARFRYRLTGGVLRIQYELVRPAKVMEAALKEMLAEIQKVAKTDVLFGLPE